MNADLEGRVRDSLEARAERIRVEAPSLAELHEQAGPVGPGRSPSRVALVAVGSAAAALLIGLAAWQVLDEEQPVSVNTLATQPTAPDSTPEPSEPPPASTPQAGPTSTPSAVLEPAPNGLAPTSEIVGVVGDGLLAGYWDGTAWVSAGDMTGSGFELDSGRSVDLAGVGEPIELPAATPTCEPSGGWVVGDFSSWSGQTIVSGDGDLLPRQPEIIAAQPAHLDDVRAHLESKGMDPQTAAITTVVRIDVDGDGQQEVLIEANSIPADEPVYGDPSQYSVLLLRRVGSDGVAETIPLHSEVGVADSVFLLRAEISALADVDGDGTLELIAQSRYHEGSGVAVWTLGLEPEQVLQAGCGA